MKIIPAIAVALALCALGNGQTAASQKVEFDAVAIKAAAQQTGHFRSSGSARGGPGTADPTLFQCTNCTVAFLISKAFALQRYQFPAQASLPDAAFDITARVPEGSAPQQFTVMLQSMLKDRFGLAYRYEKKQIQGYEMVVAKGGTKFAQSNGQPKSPDPGGAGGNWHNGNGGHDAHAGLMVFGGQGRYRGENQTTEELAQVISDQLMRPVDDHTGLQGKYDFTLTWSDDGAHAATHPAGAWEHGDHGSASAADSATGPGLIGALDAQLGLRLESKRVTANIFVVDRVNKEPSAN
jgi:uncharacterized protein (TIGR03435 family)